MAGPGAVVGGTLGWLAGIGALAIPGLGPSADASFGRAYQRTPNAIDETHRGSRGSRSAARRSESST
jgi:hypothetical protein